MRKFKRVICTILCLLITLNYNLLANADTFFKDGVDPNNYDIYKITFSDSKKVIKDNNAGLLNTEEINTILKDQKKILKK